MKLQWASAACGCLGDLATGQAEMCLLAQEWGIWGYRNTDTENVAEVEILWAGWLTPEELQGMLWSWWLWRIFSWIQFWEQKCVHGIGHPELSPEITFPCFSYIASLLLLLETWQSSRSPSTIFCLTKDLLGLLGYLNSILEKTTIVHHYPVIPAYILLGAACSSLSWFAPQIWILPWGDAGHGGTSQLPLCGFFLELGCSFAQHGRCL